LGQECFCCALTTIALLIVGLALSLGGYELAKAGLLQRSRAPEWLAGAAGIVSLGFAVVFLAFVFRWIKLNQHPLLRVSFGWDLISDSAHSACWGRPGARSAMQSFRAAQTNCSEIK
jgi:hypothetical protein